MKNSISPRLKEIVDALPVRRKMRILEIGCGPGVAARALIHLAKDVYVLGIDRSSKAIAAAKKASIIEMESGKLAFQKVAVENFELKDKEPFDIAFAVRVGALDGRHPEIEEQALTRIQAALKPKGRFFIDGGDPLKEIVLAK